MTDWIRDVFPPGIRAVQTTRLWGSHSDFDARVLPVDKKTSDDFHQSFSIDGSIQWLKQVHGNRTVEHRSDGTQPEADASFSTAPQQVCSVFTADCLPVLMANRQATWVAAIHCGWRSLYAKILKEATSNHKGAMDDLVVWLGPCIQRSAYQVKADFVDNYLNQHPVAAPAFDPVMNGHSHADLPLLARLQLQQLGIKNIHSSTDCTHDMSAHYHSWRRNQSPKRMASMIWIE